MLHLWLSCSVGAFTPLLPQTGAVTVKGLGCCLAVYDAHCKGTLLWESVLCMIQQAHLLRPSRQEMGLWLFSVTKNFGFCSKKDLCEFLSGRHQPLKLAGLSSGLSCGRPQNTGMYPWKVNGGCLFSFGLCWSDMFVRVLKCD